MSNHFDIEIYVKWRRKKLDKVMDMINRKMGHIVSDIDIYYVNIIKETFINWL